MERHISNVPYRENDIQGTEGKEPLKAVKEEADGDQFTSVIRNYIQPRKGVNIEQVLWTRGNKEFFQDNSSDNASEECSMKGIGQCNNAEDSHKSDVIGHSVFLVDQNEESSPSSDEDGNVSASFSEANEVGKQLEENSEGLMWSENDEELADFINTIKNFKRKVDQSGDAPFGKRKYDVAEGLFANTSSSYDSKKSQDFSEKQGGRIRRTRPCLFCGRFYKDLKEHLIGVHKSEELVIRAAQMPCESKRRRMFELIKKRAIEIENQARLAAGEQLLTETVQRGVRLAQCQNCLGYYSQRGFYQHKKRCIKFKTSGQEKNNLIFHNYFVDHIMKHLYQDDIYDVIIENVEIRVCGNEMFEKLKDAKIEEVSISKEVRSHMRHLATIHSIFNTFLPESENCLNYSLSEIFTMKNYNIFRKVMLDLVYEGSIQQNKWQLKEGSAVSYHNTVLDALGVLINFYSSSCDMDAKEKVNSLTLFNKHFRANKWKIFGEIEYCSVEERVQNQKMLSEEEIESIIKNNSQTINELGREGVIKTKENYVVLRRAVCTRLCFFNHTKPSDIIASLLTHHWRLAKERAHLNSTQILNANLKQSCQGLEDYRIMLTGETSDCHIIVPRILCRALDMLVDDEYRRAAHVLPENQYLFPSTNGSIRASCITTDIQHFLSEWGVDMKMSSCLVRDKIATQFCLVDYPDDTRKLFMHYLSQSLPPGSENSGDTTEVVALLRVIGSALAKLVDCGFSGSERHAVKEENEEDEDVHKAGGTGCVGIGRNSSSPPECSIKDTGQGNNTEESHMPDVTGHSVFFADQNEESCPSSDEDGNVSESFSEANGVGKQLEENSEGLKRSEKDEDLADFINSIKNWKRKVDQSGDAPRRKRRKYKVAKCPMTCTSSSYNSKKSQDLSEKQGGRIRRTRPCLFCGKFYKDLKEHLIGVHKSEELVIRAAQMPCESKRRRMFELIKKRAIEIENQARLASGEQLLTETVQKGVRLAQCRNCLGYYSHRGLYQHKKICLKQKISRQEKNNLIFHDYFKDHIMKQLCQDDIYDVIIENIEIRICGNEMFEKLKDARIEKVSISREVRSHMRHLATIQSKFNTFLPEFENCLNYSLSEIFTMKNYNIFKKVMLDLIYEGNTQQNKWQLKEGSAISYHNTVLDALGILINFYSSSCDADAEEKVNSLTLFNKYFHTNKWKIFGEIDYCSVQKRAENQKMLSEEEIESIIKSNSQTISELGREEVIKTKENYVVLRRAVCTRLYFFNHTKPSDIIASLLIHHWSLAKERDHLNSTQILNTNLKQSCQGLEEYRIMFTGEISDTPIIVPRILYRALDMLVDEEYRKAAQVLPENQYLFPSTNGSIRASCITTDIQHFLSKWGVDMKMSCCLVRDKIATQFCLVDYPDDARKLFMHYLSQSLPAGFESSDNTTEVVASLRVIGSALAKLVDCGFSGSERHAVKEENEEEEDVHKAGGSGCVGIGRKSSSPPECSMKDIGQCNNTEENHISNVIGHSVFLVDQNEESSPSSDEDGNVSETFSEANGVGKQFEENSEGLKWREDGEDLTDFINTIKNWKRKVDQSDDVPFRKRKKYDIAEGLLTYTRSTYNSKKSQDLSEKHESRKRRTRPCLFCGKFYKDLKEHLIGVHKSEELVIRAAQMPCKSKRRRMFDLIKKRAIEIENQARIAAGEQLITESVQKGVRLAQCQNCLGYYSHRGLYQHKKRCLKRKTSRQEKNSNLIFHDYFVDHIMKHLYQDDIYDVIIENIEIRICGNEMFEKLKDARIEEVSISREVRSHMRHLATIQSKFNTFLPEFENCLNYSLSEIFTMKNYDIFKKVMLDIIYEGNTQQHKWLLKEGSAISYHNTVLDALGVLINFYSSSCDADAEEKVNSLTLFDKHFRTNKWKIFGEIEYCSVQKRVENQKMLSEEEIESIIKNNSQTIDELGREGVIKTKENYVVLRRAVCTRLFFFNQTKPNDIASLLTHHWILAKERAHFNSAQLFNTNLKQGSQGLGEYRIMFTGETFDTPVVVPRILYRALDMLVDDEYRRAAQILPENQYLFPSTNGSIRASCITTDIRHFLSKWGVDMKMSCCLVRDKIATQFCLVDYPDDTRKLFMHYLSQSLPPGSESSGDTTELVASLRVIGSALAKLVDCGFSGSERNTFDEESDADEDVHKAGGSGCVDNERNSTSPPAHGETIDEENPGVHFLSEAEGNDRVLDVPMSRTDVSSDENETSSVNDVSANLPSEHFEEKQDDLEKSEDLESITNFVNIIKNWKREYPHVNISNYRKTNHEISQETLSSAKNEEIQNENSVEICDPSPQEVPKNASGSKRRLRRRICRPCLFCGKFYKDLKEHLTGVHKNEELVKIASQMRCKRKQKQMFDLMKKRGIEIENQNRLATGEQLITESMQKGARLAQCKNCLGYYSHRSICQHKKRCLRRKMLREEGTNTVNFIKFKDSKGQTSHTEFEDHVMRRLSHDDVYTIISESEEIRVCGVKMFEKLKSPDIDEKTLAAKVKNHMRRLAIIQMKFHSLPEFSNRKYDISEIFTVENFNIFKRLMLDIIYEDNSQIEEDQRLKTGVAVQYQCAVLDALMALMRFYSLSNDRASKAKVKSLSIFDGIYRKSKQDIFENFNNSNLQRRIEIQKMLPEKEIDLLIKNNTQILVEYGKKDVVKTSENYVTLRKAVCSRLAFFNRRKASDITTLMTHHWTFAKERDFCPSDNIYAWLRESSQILDDYLIMFGGDSSNIPIVVPKILHSSLDMLVDEEFRAAASVPIGNAFLFPSVHFSLQPCKVSSDIRSMLTECGIDMKVSSHSVRHAISSKLFSADCSDKSREQTFQFLVQYEKLGAKELCNASNDAISQAIGLMKNIVFTLITLGEKSRSDDSGHGSDWDEGSADEGEASMRECGDIDTNATFFPIRSGSSPSALTYEGETAVPDLLKKTKAARVCWKPEEEHILVQAFGDFVTCKGSYPDPARVLDFLLSSSLLSSMDMTERKNAVRRKLNNMKRLYLNQRNKYMRKFLETEQS